MKRVISACLSQTLHFILDERFSHEEALSKVNNEVTAYKEQYKNSIKILDQEALPDGSVILKIKKTVLGYPIGDYFNEEH